MAAAPCRQWLHAWAWNSATPSWCLQIVFVSTEIAPWSKVGGLGDVLATLPVALAAR
jgi:hypothetical protein